MEMECNDDWHLYLFMFAVFQAQQIGIFTEDFKFIFANLDFHSFDLEEFKYSEANITSFRMFSPENPQVKEIMQRMGYYKDFANEEDPRLQKYEKEKVQNGMFNEICHKNM